MISISENISLKPYHTFATEAKARYFAIFTDVQELNVLLKDKRFAGLPCLILGGGSNILFTQDFDGLVLQNNIRGVDILREDKSSHFVKVGGGENWDDFVAYCVNQGWGGLENLSYIPGNVGAAPIQNIGAYGTEVKESIQLVQTLNKENQLPISYTNSDCLFDYRSSIFKNQLKGKRIITHVVFTLSKKPRFNLNYGILYETVSSKGPVNLNNIRQSVIEIRKNKLPDPKKTGNAGSFFKNPVVDKKAFGTLQSAYPDIPSYTLQNKKYKLPAGWLIDKLGWKGYREGDAGVHPKQALVLVNYGNATGKEILQLSKKIHDSVRSKFGINLAYEVNIL